MWERLETPTLGSITTCRLGCCGGSPAPMVVSDGGAGILPASMVRTGSPDTVFRQRDLNASISEDGTRDQSVEVRLGEEFEPEFKAITGKLVDQGRFGKCPQLTAREKTRLDEFLYVQSKRSPEWRTESLERDVYRDLMGRELPSGVPPRIGTGLGASPPQRARRILQNDFADSLLRGSSEVARVLRAKGLLLCRVPRGRALVVGTTAVVSAGSGAGSLDELHRGLALPLASDVLLYVGGESGVREHRDLTATEVETINGQIFRHSHGIAGQSSELVRSVVCSR